MMRKFDTPYMADWFAISLRWIMLVGLVVSLGLGGKLEVSVSWPLGLMVAWNLVMTALASLNVRMRYHRRISMLVDLVLGGGVFLGTGRYTRPGLLGGLVTDLNGFNLF